MKKYNAAEMARKYADRTFWVWTNYPPTQQQWAESIARLLRKAHKRGREDVANELCERVGKAQQEDEEMLALHRRGL